MDINLFNNYFSLFGLETNFNIDLEGLKLAYISLQQKYHPDKFVTEPTQVKLTALDYSIRLNEAYETLRSEVKRAEYLFKLLGGSEQPHEQELLLEELQKRELLETDLALEAVDDLYKMTQQEKSAILAKFTKACHDLDLSLAHKFLTKLKFNIKFCEEIKRKKSQLL